MSWAHNKVLAVLRLAGVAALTGCADREHSGRRILADLGQQGVALTDEHDLQWAGPGSAVDAGALPSTGPISLEDLWRGADAGNADLAAARGRVGVAAGGALQASRYPNPWADVKAEEVPIEGGLSQGITTVGVTQPVILGDRRGAAMDAADSEQVAALADMEARRWEVFAEVAALHARLLTIRETRLLYAELGGLAGSSLETARARFEARAATETEVIRPQVEVYRLEIAVARLERERATATEQLGLLLGGVEIDPERLAGAATAEVAELDLLTLRDSVRHNHPLLASADAAVAAAEGKLAQVRAERTPDLEVRVGAGYNGESDQAIVEAGLGITVPLWDDRRGDVLSARFAIAGARQERLAAEAELLGRLAEVHGQYAGAMDQIVAVRERLIPATERAYEQTSEAYRAGLAGSLELLEAQRALAEARTSLAELSGVAAVARARLVALAGPAIAARPGAAGAGTVGSGTGSVDSGQRPMGAEVHP